MRVAPDANPEPETTMAATLTTTDAVMVGIELGWSGRDIHGMTCPRETFRENAGASAPAGLKVSAGADADGSWWVAVSDAVAGGDGWKRGTLIRSDGRESGLGSYRGYSRCDDAEGRGHASVARDLAGVVAAAAARLLSRPEVAEKIATVAALESARLAQIEADCRAAHAARQSQDAAVLESMGAVGGRVVRGHPTPGRATVYDADGCSKGYVSLPG